MRLLSGYRDRRWGLGEIEVFGTGALMRPDDDLYYVNTDIPLLTSGTTYHYRLVARNSAGIAQGESRSFAVPAIHQPLVDTGGASRVTPLAAKVEGRLNPMGLRTQFYFEYGIDNRYGQKTPSRYGGLQITPRSVFDSLTDLEPGTTYHYRLAAVNAQGTRHGEDASFRTAMGK